MRSTAVIFQTASPNRKSEIARAHKIAEAALHDSFDVVVRDLAQYLADNPLQAALDLPFVIVDVTNFDQAAAWLIGARRANPALMTLAVCFGTASPKSRRLFGDSLVELGRGGRGDADLSTRLRDIQITFQAAGGGGSSPAARRDYLNQRVEGPPLHWRVLPDKTHQVGIWQGNISDVRQIDVWVNPENTFMDMARIHDLSVSGIIRYLGSEWSHNNSDSDDFVFRELLDAIAKRDGVARPVRPATAYVTHSGQLAKLRNVKAIAHVACVEPYDAGRPGSGYKPVADLGACVTSVLKEITKDPISRRLETALVPLFGTGTGRGDVRATSEILARAAVDFLAAERPAHLKRVYFLAFTRADLENCKSALDNLQGVRGVVIWQLRGLFVALVGLAGRNWLQLLEIWTAIQTTWPILFLTLLAAYTLAFMHQGFQALLAVLDKPNTVFFVTCAILVAFGLLIHGWILEFTRRPYPDRLHGYRRQRTNRRVAAAASLFLPLAIGIIALHSFAGSDRQLGKFDLLFILSGPICLAWFFFAQRKPFAATAAPVLYLWLAAFVIHAGVSGSAAFATQGGAFACAVLVAILTNALERRWYRRYESSFAQLVTLDFRYTWLLRALLFGFVFAGALSFIPEIQERIGPVGILILGTGVWSVVLAWLVSHIATTRAPALVAFLILLLILQGLFTHTRHGVRTVAQRDGVPDTNELVEKWLSGAEKRAGPTGDIPVVVVLAEGGGIYAALNSAGTLAELDRLTNETLYPNIFVLSAVSGGSFGVATYLAARADAVEGDRLTAIKTFMSRDYLSPLMSGLFFSDILLGLLPFGNFFDCIPDRAALQERAFERQWAASALQPNAGAPAHTPARAQNAFAEAFVDVIHDATGRDASGKDAAEPIVFFGATREADGHLATVSNATLDEPNQQRASAIRNIGADVRLPLSTAAGISARFPFITPPAVINADPATNRPTMQYVDGGYIDVSGSLAARRAVELLLSKARPDIKARLKIIVLHFFERTTTADDPADASLEMFAPSQAAGAVLSVPAAFAREALCQAVADQAAGQPAGRVACADPDASRRFDRELGVAFKNDCEDAETTKHRDTVVAATGSHWINAPLDISAPGSRCFVPLGWYLGNGDVYVGKEIERRSKAICAALKQALPAHLTTDWNASCTTDEP